MVCSAAQQGEPSLTDRLTDSACIRSVSDRTCAFASRQRNQTLCAGINHFDDFNNGALNRDQCFQCMASPSDSLQIAASAMYLNLCVRQFDNNAKCKGPICYQRENSKLQGLISFLAIFAGWTKCRWIIIVCVLQIDWST